MDKEERLLRASIRSRRILAHLTKGTVLEDAAKTGYLAEADQDAKDLRSKALHSGKGMPLTRIVLRRLEAKKRIEKKRIENKKKDRKVRSLKSKRPRSTA